LGERRMRILAFCLAALAAVGVSCAQEMPSVEAFGRLPAIADAAISPDGSKVALITSDERGATAIVVHDLDRGQRLRRDGAARGPAARCQMGGSSRSTRPAASFLRFMGSIVRVARARCYFSAKASRSTESFAILGRAKSSVRLGLRRRPARNYSFLPCAPRSNTCKRQFPTVF